MIPLEAEFGTFRRFFLFHVAFWHRVRNLALKRDILLRENPNELGQASWRTVRGYLSRPTEFFDYKNDVLMLEEISEVYRDSV